MSDVYDVGEGDKTKISYHDSWSHFYNTYVSQNIGFLTISKPYSCLAFKQTTKKLFDTLFNVYKSAFIFIFTYLILYWKEENNLQKC